MRRRTTRIVELGKQFQAMSIAIGKLLLSDSQCKGNDDYHDQLVDGKPVTNPFDVETIVPGWYRLRDPK